MSTVSALPLLAARAVSLRLASRSVLHGVSLALPAGQWTAIIGPNGAGKSSLLSLLGGLRAPTQGEVWLRERRLADWDARERARRLAWLAQEGAAEAEIAARDVVRLGRLPRHGLLGTPDAQDESAVDAAMAETESAAFARRPLRQLSGGERQRVLLARVLAVQSEVLLMDEPTAHLDAPHQRTLLAGLAARARSGAAVVTVLHDLTQALAADRVVLMQDGRVRGDGAPGDPALHAAIEQVFQGAFGIQAVEVAGRRRWVAVPLP